MYSVLLLFIPIVHIWLITRLDCNPSSPVMCVIHLSLTSGSSASITHDLPIHSTTRNYLQCSCDSCVLRDIIPHYLTSDSPVSITWIYITHDLSVSHTHFPIHVKLVFITSLFHTDPLHVTGFTSSNCLSHDLTSILPVRDMIQQQLLTNHFFCVTYPMIQPYTTYFNFLNQPNFVYSYYSQVFRSYYSSVPHFHFFTRDSPHYPKYLSDSSTKHNSWIFTATHL